METHEGQSLVLGIVPDCHGGGVTGKVPRSSLGSSCFCSVVVVCVAVCIVVCIAVGSVELLFLFEMGICVEECSFCTGGCLGFGTLHRAILVFA